MSSTSQSAQPVLHINDSAGLPISLEIKGKTIQPENKAIYYSSYLKDVKNYISAGVNGAYAISLPASWQGKTAKYSFEINALPNSVSAYLSDGASFLFSNTQALINNQGTSYEVTGSTFTHLIFTGILGEERENENGDVIHVLRELIDFWEVNELFVEADVSRAFPSPIYCSGDTGIDLIFSCGNTEKTVKIPTEITLDGKTIPLLFSEYDSLIVDGINKTVTYRLESWKRVVTGKEAWIINDYAQRNGYGNYYVYWTYGIGVYPKSSTGYSTHYKISKARHPAPYDSLIIEQSQYLIQLCTDRVESVADFKARLVGQYESGDAVEILVRRTSPIFYDLTSTELGRELLSLVVPIHESGEISIISKCGISNSTLSYYTVDEEKKFRLGVSYLNERGEEIKEGKEYFVRSGSFYKIIPPHIDGYLSVSQKESGVMTADTEIDLYYKEEK